MKKVGMLGVLTNLGTRLYSHNAGWTYVTRSILSERLGQNVDIVSNTDDFDKYDALVINEGANFKPGVFNFFGGVQDRQIDSLKKFSAYKGHVLYLNDFADYTIPCKKRKDLSDHADLTFPKGRVIDITKYGDSVIVGDSHSISAWEPSRTINRLDGKTLNGALKIGLKNLIPTKNQKNVQFYFGNIDVRHHLIRLEASVKELADRYITEASKYNAKIYELLPIEHESRKLPQSGYYKGQPYWGSWQQRTDIRNEFNDYIEKQYGIIIWTDKLLNKAGELDFKYMEKPKSIHLSREFYPYWNGIETINNNTLEEFF